MRLRTWMCPAMAAAVAGFCAAPAVASWHSVSVFASGSEGRGVVNADGTVRWAARAPALWRSRSAGGRLSSVVRLQPSNAPTLDSNATGDGIALYGSSGQLLAVRRAVSGRAAFAARAVASRASIAGAGIASSGASRLAWRSGGALFTQPLSGRGTLGAPQRLGPAPLGNRSGYFPLSVAPTGWAVIAWVQRAPAVAESWTLRVAVARPGRAFGAPRDVSTYTPPRESPGGQRELSVAIGNTGATAVAWLQGGKRVDERLTQYAGGDVYAATAHAGGAFGTPQKLSAGTAPDRPIGLAFSPGGAALAAWADQANSGGGDLPARIAASSASSGTRFGAVQRIDRFSAGVSGPDVAFDTRGNALVAWARHLSGTPGSTGTDRVMASLRRGGARFAAAQPASSARGIFPAPAASGGGRGTFAITWDNHAGRSRGVASAVYTP